MDAEVSDKAYPGALASPYDMWRLANEYRAAAHLLLKSGRRGDPLSWAPYRLSTIHAIELYLNVLLLQEGHSASNVRGMQHRFADRIACAAICGLRLRKRTEAHLLTMDVSREYLVTRYGPEMTSTTSQINRLMATLEELADKVTAKIALSSNEALPSSISRPRVASV